MLIACNSLIAQVGRVTYSFHITELSEDVLMFSVKYWHCFFKHRMQAANYDADIHSLPFFLHPIPQE
jgi:hypothetical protein